MAALSLLGSLMASLLIDKHRAQIHDDFLYLLEARTFAEGPDHQPATKAAGLSDPARPAFAGLHQ